jgi:hypothetical protein
MRGPIVIAGAMAQQARQGGLSWFYLQFLLGLRRLGWDVLFLDRLEPEMCRDEAGDAAPFETSLNKRYFLRVMRDFGMDGAFSLTHNGGEHVVGLPRRVFLDIDPGFGQMWRDLGLHDPFRGHDDFVTLGMNIGRPGCAIPTCGLKWVTMPQHWPVAPAGEAGAFTSIGAWRGPNAPLEYKGTTYGLRAHEFRRFVELPSMCPGERFEMAFDIHPADVKDLNLLARNGWSLVDPKTVAGTPQAYRAYVTGSRAEFMVPKHMYVQSNSGLLSDRSAYYLASGKPVLARDTGITRLYRTGEGLLTFSSVEEAAEGVERIRREYPRHAKAARAVAEEFFDSDKVLARLLRDLNV